MKQTNLETIAEIRDYATQHPETNYKQIAVTFGLSVATIKRYSVGLGRSKKWRTGRKSDTSDPQRFWLKVNRKEPDDCWLWTGCLNNSGYGFVYSGGQNKAAHRLAYELTKGPIADGLEIDHLCRNRLCCNPGHLEQVTHRENLERRPPRLQQPNIDTDTGVFVAPIRAQEAVLHNVHDAISESENIETTAPSVSVSIQQSQPQVMPFEGKRRSTPVIAAKPAKADPFAPICLMQAPPELEIPEHPARAEGASGTKADLGIEDWAQTEYGSFWWGQTDDRLRTKTVYQQTEAMREDGEFLHWYAVYPTNPVNTRQFMSARNGPEAALKIDRCYGRGWAASWEYVQPDPHRALFYQHRVVLINGDRAMTVARTVADAVAMVEEVWGQGVVLECERMGRPDLNHLKMWSQNWRQYLKHERSQLEERRRAA